MLNTTAGAESQNTFNKSHLSVPQIFERLGERFKATESAVGCAFILSLLITLHSPYQAIPNGNLL